MVFLYLSLICFLLYRCYYFLLVVSPAVIVGTGTAVYTSSWVAPRSDVHSQQRFFYMGQVILVTSYVLRPSDCSVLNVTYSAGDLPCLPFEFVLPNDRKEKLLLIRRIEDIIWPMIQPVIALSTLSS